MNNQHQLEQQIVIGNRTAAMMMKRIITIPGMAEALREGYDNHGDSFLALLLVPSAISVSPEKLLEVFSAAHCGKGDTPQDALNELLDHLGWTQRLTHLHEEIGISNILTWEWSPLREALEEDYAFVDTYTGCHVFDLNAIRAKLES